MKVQSKRVEEDEKQVQLPNSAKSCHMAHSDGGHARPTLWVP